MRWLELFFLVACWSCCQAALIQTDPSLTTFRLAGSTASFTVWSTPVANRIRSTSTEAPQATRARVDIYCAREELESFQLVVAPGAGTFSVDSFNNFAGLPADSTLEAAVAGFTDASPWGQGAFQVTDALEPLAPGSVVTRSAALPSVLWFTVYVPASACGKRTYSTEIRLTPSGGGAQLVVPVQLYVFDVVLDVSPHLTMVGSNVPNLVRSQPPVTPEQTDAVHAQYLRHRTSPILGTWPTSFLPAVGWDADTHTLKGLDTTRDCYSSAGCLFKRYNLGKGSAWNGETLPDWLGSGYRSSAATYTTFSRPDPFGGVACDTPAPFSNTARFRGWMCSEAYEAEWANYLGQLNTFFTAEMGAQSYAENTKGYWYTLNEPQNDNDYAVAAYLCKQAHERAPGMKVMISREATPGIYDRQDGLSCGYDIWMAPITRFPSFRTWTRQAPPHNEISWIYFLDIDGNCRQQNAGGITCNPYLQPVVSASGRSDGSGVVQATSGGMHYRAIPWVLWSMRVSGWYYYASGKFWDESQMTAANGYKPARPRVSAALIREGMEDYEYLWQLNCGRAPEAFKQSPADAAALSIGLHMGSWRRGPTAADELEQLRIELGKYLEGTRGDIPTLVTPKEFPFAALNFDFRNDPGTNVPYEFEGRTWIPCDLDNRLDVEKGFGWQSSNLEVKDDAGVPKLRCQGSGNLASSVCYDVQSNEFHVYIKPGSYRVTVAVGWEGRGARDQDGEYVAVNGVVLRDVVCSTVPGTCVGSREYTGDILVRSHGPGGALVMTTGKPDQGKFTIFSYMRIEPLVEGTPDVQGACTRPMAPPCNGMSAPPTTTTSTSAGGTSSPTRAPTTTAAPTTRAPTGTPTTRRPTLPGATPAPTTASPTSAAPTVGAPTTHAPTRPAPNGVSGCEESERPADAADFFTVVLDKEFATFDCNAFFASIAARLAVPQTALLLTGIRSGSTVVDVACLDAGCRSSVDTFMAAVTAGSVQELAIISATDRTDAAFAPPSSNGGAIAGAIVGVLVVAALVALLVVLLLRRRANKAHSRPSPGVAPYQAPVPHPQRAAAPSHLSFRASANTNGDAANSILGLTRGQSVVVQLSDWRSSEGQDWVWASVGGQEGYAPRALLAQ